jgi:hypothetical protein
VNVAIEIDLTRWGGVRPRLQQQQRFFIRIVSQTKCQSSNGDKAARRTFIVEGRRQKKYTDESLSLRGIIFEPTVQGIGIWRGSNKSTIVIYLGDSKETNLNFRGRFIITDYNNLSEAVAAQTYPQHVMYIFRNHNQFVNISSRRCKIIFISSVHLQLF